MRKIFLLLLSLCLLCGCAAPAAQTQPTTVPTQPETTAATTLPPETVAETTLPEPTETEPPAPVLHSGMREDGSFDEGTLFLGDSHTYLFAGQYLKPKNYLGDAKVAAQCGAQLTVYFDEDLRPARVKEQAYLFSPEFADMTFREAALAMGEKATAIYIMWGTNYTPNAGAESYIAIVEDLLQICPNATIHLQLIPTGNVPHETVNGWITGAWEYFRDLGEPRVLLIDTFNGVGNNLVSDRIHMNETGRANWYATLVRHKEENGLAQ